MSVLFLRARKVKEADVSQSFNVSLLALTICTIYNITLNLSALYVLENRLCAEVLFWSFLRS